MVSAPGRKLAFSAMGRPGKVSQIILQEKMGCRGDVWQTVKRRRTTENSQLKQWGAGNERADTPADTADPNPLRPPGLHSAWHPEVSEAPISATSHPLRAKLRTANSPRTRALGFCDVARKSPLLPISCSKFFKFLFTVC